MLQKTENSALITADSNQLKLNTYKLNIQDQDSAEYLSINVMNTRSLSPQIYVKNVELDTTFTKARQNVF